MAKKKQEEKNRPPTAEEILEAAGWELAPNNEPIDLPEQVYFDDDVLEQNIIINSIRKVGERETKYGLTTDYLMNIILPDGNSGFLRSNHAYVFAVIYRLDKYKAPIKCRIRKGKGEKGRYFLAAWLDVVE